MSPILQVRDVTKSFGAAVIIRGVSLCVGKGERHAIIGPNGAGKSTLFGLLSGQFPPSSGDILLDDRNIAGLAPFRINRLGLARSFQITNLFPRLSVFENVRTAVMGTQGYRTTLWRFVDGLIDVNARCHSILDQVGLRAVAQSLAGALSYSEQRALEIGMALACDPEVILLDEPTAGMSRDETKRAIELILNVTVNKTLLLVEHDMEVVFSLADRISVLVNGSIQATGSPNTIKNDAGVQAAYLGTEPV